MLYNNIVHLTNTCVTFFFYVRNEKVTKTYSQSRARVLFISCQSPHKNTVTISSAYVPNLYDGLMMEVISGKILVRSASFHEHTLH